MQPPQWYFAHTLRSARLQPRVLDDEFSFPTCQWDTIRVRVVRAGAAALTHEERVRGREALRELRRGVRWKDAPVLLAAQRLHQAVRHRMPLFEPERLDATLFIEAFLERLLDDLEDDFELGRLRVSEGAFPLLGVPPELELTEKERVSDPAPAPPPIARPAPPETLTFFEVRFVDEIGQAIGGLEVEFRAGARVESVTTNPAGVALLEDVKSMSATVGVVSSEALGKIVEPRWDKPRTGSPPTGQNTKSFLFTGSDLAGVSLKPAVPNTIVIMPPLGKLLVELWDKTGRVRHIGQDYQVSGPETFTGTTDEEGRLLHEDVTPGDYVLDLSVEVDQGDGSSVVDNYQSPLVVLEPGAGSPQVRMLGVVPYVVMARMRGLLFDTNKSFLLPTAQEALQKIRAIYEANNPSELLIVGHTDTTAQPDINDPLSKERADSMKAYLEDDVDTWLDNYNLSGKKCWGSREDRLMIAAMPDFASRGEDEDLVEWFQRTRELTVDGKAGPQTRRQLITEYMALDGVRLSEEPDFHLSIQTHGAGENFPLAGTGFELDQAAADEQEDPFDRRVELFFFDTDFGVLPAPGAPDGPEYLKWRERAAENSDFPVEGIGKKATVIEFHDALFRTNSCVVLPEGETPSDDEHEAVTGVGLFATTLRFAEEHPKKKLFLAGHTDTTASEDFNQKLSEERAQCALALLEGDRERFATLTDERHTVADYKQILSWCSKAFPEMFAECDPGEVDDNEFTGIEPLKKFQAAYNENKAALGASSQPDLAVDGDIGPKTWGAMFDVYQFGIREELGEDEAGVAKLREGLVFVDDERKALGFSEHHPVDQVGRDNVRSQSNRRVEVLFFDEGEEPDLKLAESDPDISEIYLPAEYEHRGIPPLISAKRTVFRLRALGFDLDPIAITQCTVVFGGEEQVQTTDSDGVAGFKSSSFERTCTVRWLLPDGTETIRKDVIVTPASGDEGTAQRLVNLGHDLEDLEAQVRGHQLEFGREPSGKVADVSAEILDWHDFGIKPAVQLPSASSRQNIQAKTLLANTTGKLAARLITAAPTVTPVLLNPESLVPRFETIKTGSGRLIGMKIPAGCHSAISFQGAEKGRPIVVNTSPNTVDFRDNSTYLDVDTGKDRQVFFYAKRVLPRAANKRNPKVVRENPLMLQGQRVIFQLEVHETPFPGRRNVPLAHLFGKVFALNSSDISAATIMWPGERSASVSPTTPLSKMIDKVLDEAARVGGVLDHLVINGHGGFDPALGQTALKVKIGQGIRRNNVQEFGRLRSHVRFIWFANCVIGADNVLLGDIALHSQARVTGPITLELDAKFPRRHIEIERDNKHWDGRGANSRPSPMDRTEFFRLARRNTTPKTDETALDFNVVTSPKGPTP